MKALISKTEPRETGYRVAQVVTDNSTFPVAEPDLFWVSCANDVVQGLIDAIAGYEAQAAKAETAGNSAKAKTAREAAEARKVWLAEAQKGLSDFKA